MTTHGDNTEVQPTVDSVLLIRRTSDTGSVDVLAAVPSEEAPAGGLLANFVFHSTKSGAHNFVVTGEDGECLYVSALSHSTYGGDALAVCVCSSRPLYGLLSSAARWLTGASDSSAFLRRAVFLTRELPLPAPGYSVSVAPAGGSVVHSTSFVECPALADDPAMTLLFTLLPPPAIIDLLRALLTEQRIIVLAPADKAPLLAPVCQAAMSLVWPLTWSGAYAPYLPDISASELADMLDAPCPYLLGMPSEWRGSIPDEIIRRVVIVDLGSGCVSLPGKGGGAFGRLFAHASSAEGGVPALPVSLHKSLLAVLKQLASDIYGAKAGSPEAEASSAALSAYNSPVSSKMALFNSTSICQLTTAAQSAVGLIEECTEDRDESDEDAFNSGIAHGWSAAQYRLQTAPASASSSSGVSAKLAQTTVLQSLLLPLLNDYDCFFADEGEKTVEDTQQYLGLRFDRDAAVAAHPELAPFLSAVLQTQAFDAFLTQRLCVSAFTDPEVLFFDALCDTAADSTGKLSPYLTDPSLAGPSKDNLIAAYCPEPSSVGGSHASPLGTGQVDRLCESAGIAGGDGISFADVYQRAAAAQLQVPQADGARMRNGLRKQRISSVYEARSLSRYNSSASILSSNFSNTSGSDRSLMSRQYRSGRRLIAIAGSAVIDVDASSSMDGSSGSSSSGRKSLAAGGGGSSSLVSPAKKEQASWLAKMFGRAGRQKLPNASVALSSSASAAPSSQRSPAAASAAQFALPLSPSDTSSITSSYQAPSMKSLPYVGGSAGRKRKFADSDSLRAGEAALSVAIPLQVLDPAALIKATLNSPVYLPAPSPTGGAGAAGTHKRPRRQQLMERALTSAPAAAEQPVSHVASSHSAAQEQLPAPSSPAFVPSSGAPSGPSPAAAAAPLMALTDFLQAGGATTIATTLMEADEAIMDEVDGAAASAADSEPTGAGDHDSGNFDLKGRQCISSSPQPLLQPSVQQLDSETGDDVDIVGKSVDDNRRDELHGASNAVALAACGVECDETESPSLPVTGSPPLSRSPAAAQHALPASPSALDGDDENAVVAGHHVSEVNSAEDSGSIIAAEEDGGLTNPRTRESIDSIDSVALIPLPQPSTVSLAPVAAAAAGTDTSSSGAAVLAMPADSHLLAEVTRLRLALARSQRENRRLREELQCTKGNVRVMVRVRPIVDTRKLPASSSVSAVGSEVQQTLCVVGDEGIRAVKPGSGGVTGASAGSVVGFDFDRCFGTSCGQAELYSELEASVAAVASAGRNACIIAYGQTGSGKTYTMNCGPHDSPLPPALLADSADAAHLTEADLPSECGVYARSLITLFSELADAGAVVTGSPVSGSSSSSSPAAASAEHTAEVRVGMFEIYKEEIRDLLQAAKVVTHAHGCDCGGCDGVGTPSDKVTVRQSSTAGAAAAVQPTILYEGLLTPAVTSARAGLRLLAAGNSARAVASNGINARSSRSHSVVVIYVKRTQRTSLVLQGAAGDVINSSVTSGKLVLVDLAGCERLAKLESEASSASSSLASAAPATGLFSSVANWFSSGRPASSSGLAAAAYVATSTTSAFDIEARVEESKAINSSLAVLNQCIMSLAADSPSNASGSSDGAKKQHQPQQHVPYRDSTLTYALRDCLGGSARTTLLCMVSPAPSDVSETLNTLEFGARARRIKSRAVANVAAVTQQLHAGRGAKASASRARVTAPQSSSAATSRAAVEPSQQLAVEASSGASAEQTGSLDHTGRRASDGGSIASIDALLSNQRAANVSVSAAAVDSSITSPQQMKSPTKRQQPRLAVLSNRNVTSAGAAAASPAAAAAAIAGRSLQQQQRMARLASPKGLALAGLAGAAGRHAPGASENAH